MWVFSLFKVKTIQGHLDTAKSS